MWVLGISRCLVRRKRLQKKTKRKGFDGKALVIVVMSTQVKREEVDFV